MRGEAWSWGNGACQFKSQSFLLLRRFAEQYNHQLFQRDHANLQLYQFSIGEPREIGSLFT